MLGFIILAVVLGLGMGFSIYRFESAADEQVRHIRAAEHELSIVDQLRWSTELIVADGRGYLLARDPNLLQRLHESKLRLRQTLNTLELQPLSSEGLSLTKDVERAVDRFIAIQETLVEARQESADARTVAARFEAELLPARRELEAAMARLAEHKRESLRRTYEATVRERATVSKRLYGLLTILVPLSIAIAWYFARRLGRSLKNEQDALAMARSAVAARDELMGVVAHDLRNPLNAITVQASLMRDAAEHADAKKQADSIIRVGRRMDQLIGMMLDVATIEAGRFTVRPVRCNVEDLIRESLETFSPIAAAKRVRIEAHLIGDDLAVMADKDRVLQVLSNLLGNALKFTPEGGKIWVTAQPHANMVRFTVDDTGPGIAPQNLARVFDRFWKDESGGKRGTGLGLFIAKGIVVAHEGTIWSESELGRGTSFVFTLPMASPPSSAGESESVVDVGLNRPGLTV